MKLKGGKNKGEEKKTVVSLLFLFPSEGDRERKKVDQRLQINYGRKKIAEEK